MRVQRVLMPDGAESWTVLDVGVQVPVAVPVASSDPGISDPPPRRATHRVGISWEQGVDKRRQHLTHQVRRRLGQVLVQKVSAVNAKRSGDRLFVYYDDDDTLTGLPVHHSAGLNSLVADAARGGWLVLCARQEHPKSLPDMTEQPRRCGGRILSLSV